MSETEGCENETPPPRRSFSPVIDEMAARKSVRQMMTAEFHDFDSTEPKPSSEAKLVTAREKCIELTGRERILSEKYERTRLELQDALTKKEQFEKALNEVDSVLELREIIESYEQQFIHLIPDDLRPTKIHTNPAKIYESRYSRWIWILKYCSDERIKVLAKVLEEKKATDRFCVMVSSLYASMSKRIHYPTIKTNHSATEIIASLRNQGILRDASLENVILLLVDVLPMIPSSVADATKELQSAVADATKESQSAVPSKRDIAVASDGDTGDGASNSKKQRLS